MPKKLLNDNPPQQRLKVTSKQVPGVGLATTVGASHGVSEGGVWARVVFDITIEQNTTKKGISKFLNIIQV
jgi:hypothetical protein